MIHTIPIAIAAAIVIAAPSAAEYDLRTVSAHTAESISGYMHPETRHLAEDVIRICADEGISAEFIVSVMRWERRAAVVAMIIAAGKSAWGIIIAYWVVLTAKNTVDLIGNKKGGDKNN